MNKKILTLTKQFKKLPKAIFSRKPETHEEKSEEFFNELGKVY
jgi:hypothetical protein